ncbi:hypothetical protein GOV04_00795 [Candidatus Woesearchaeota archaeon]|nr:hypothetical protein [Candidatus Woesearchaeota archaeon]
MLATKKDLLNLNKSLSRSFARVKRDIEIIKAMQEHQMAYKAEIKYLQDQIYKLKHELYQEITKKKKTDKKK